jgi:hypothetical protein
LLGGLQQGEGEQRGEDHRAQDTPAALTASQWVLAGEDGNRRVPSWNPLIAKGAMNGARIVAGSRLLA